MKILIDENLPKQIKNDLIGFDVFSVREMKWNGRKNGELLASMQEFGFGTLITFDKNLQFQHNLTKYQITVFVIDTHTNRYSDIAPHLPEIIEYLTSSIQEYKAVVIPTFSK